MELLDQKILSMIEQSYILTEKEREDFLELIKDFDENEKIELAQIFWERLQQEKNILQKLYQKLKFIWYNLKDLLVRKEADKLIEQI